MKFRYTGIWLLLASTMVLVMLISFLDDIKLGGWTIKRAPYKEILLSEAKEETSDQRKRKIEELEARNSVESTVVDSLPQSILLIGDSMTLNLAYRLSQYAAANGHKFHAVNWDSSNTKIWGECDTLSHFINQYGASYVFVSLGSNELYLTHPDSRKKYVEAILSQIADLPYVWIGPPNWKEDFGINDMIEECCRPGAFFRSAGMTFERKKDRIHPTRNASALWIDSIARWMPKSEHPILMDTPPDTLGKINPQVTFLKALNK